jgi:TfoX/Sxy family transcriptional regulator of competence genes
VAAHDPKALQAILEAAAPPDAEIGFRSMFGGIMVYAGGKPMASLSDVGLALKMTGDGHAALLAVKGAKRLRYEPDAPESKTYIVVPDAMLDDRAALRGWIERCITGLPATKPKRAGKSRSGSA